MIWSLRKFLYVFFYGLSSEFPSLAEFITDQTCEVGSQCPFSHGLDLTRDLTFCKDAFGVSEKSVFQQANFTNDYYGSDKPKGGRILFINGEN